MPCCCLHSASTPLTSTSSSAGHGGVIALFALHRILQQAGEGWPSEADVWLRIRTSDSKNGKKEVTEKTEHIRNDVIVPTLAKICRGLGTQPSLQPHTLTHHTRHPTLTPPPASLQAFSPRSRPTLTPTRI